MFSKPKKHKESSLVRRRSASELQFHNKMKNPPPSKPNIFEESMQKSMDIILKHQKEFENRIRQTLDERFHLSLYMRKHLEEMKNRELEMKIQILKEENQNSIIRKMQLEAQLNLMRQIPSPSIGTLGTLGTPVALSSPYYFSEGDTHALQRLHFGSDHFPGRVNTGSTLPTAGAIDDKSQGHFVDKTGTLDKLVTQPELRSENEFSQEPQRIEKFRQRIPSIDTQMSKLSQNVPVQDDLAPDLRPNESTNRLPSVKSLPSAEANGIVIAPSVRTPSLLRRETRDSIAWDDKNSPYFGIISPTLKSDASLSHLEKQDSELPSGKRESPPKTQTLATSPAKMPLVIVKTPSGRFNKIIRSGTTESSLESEDTSNQLLKLQPVHDSPESVRQPEDNLTCNGRNLNVSNLL